MSCALVLDEPSAPGSATEAPSFRLAFMASPTAMVITDAQGCILAANRAYERLTGRSAADLLGSQPVLKRDAGEGHLFSAEEGESIDVRVPHRDGGEHRAWMSRTSVRGSDGKVRLHVATFADLAGIDQRCESWRQRARHDALTGLPNRPHLDAELPRSMARAARQGQRLAVLFVDIDRFKTVNDAHGHEAGDELLKALGRRLRGTLRAEDLVARYGGDEFVVLLEAPRHAGDAAAAAGALLNAVSSTTMPAASADAITASIGIAIFPDDAVDAGRLLRMADQAMYRAKRAGGNTFAFCDTAPV